MLKVKLNRIRGASEKEKAKLERCRAKLEVIVNHPDFKQEFKNEFFNHQFYGETSKKYDELMKLNENELKIASCPTCFQTDLNKKRELQFEKLWNYFYSGSETLNPEADNEIDIDITIAWGKRGVVGWTYPSTVRTWINRRFFRWYSDKNSASNMLHEAAHKIGFNHDYNRTKRRPYSICYTFNRVFKKVYEQVFIE